jgi:hypothetical protein
VTAAARSLFVFAVEATSFRALSSEIVANVDDWMAWMSSATHPVRVKKHSFSGIVI